MSNPIQDWLDKLTKKTTVSGTTSVSSTAKPKVTGTAGVGTKVAKPQTKVEIDLNKQREAIGQKRNQDIINAAYKVADELKLKGGPWPLLRSAGWGHLTDKRGDLYKGPAIDEIEALTPEVKIALKRVLGL